MNRNFKIVDKSRSVLCRVVVIHIDAFQSKGIYILLYFSKSFHENDISDFFCVETQNKRKIILNYKFISKLVNYYFRMQREKGGREGGI